MKLGKPEELPINKSKVIIQLSEGTIRGVIEALVELITNSDDSYRNLEDFGRTPDGKIETYITRQQGGKCDEIIVRDFAEGMAPDKLKAAAEFAGETSGFYSGKSVRGFMGRGLKEAIVSLGEGEIFSRVNGELHGRRIWREKVDGRDKILNRELTDLTNSEIESIGLGDRNGTVVRIFNIKEKFKVVDHKIFFEQIKKHYALRDINSSAQRNVKLFFDSKPKIEIETPIKFLYPEGKLKLEKHFSLPRYDDLVKLKIYEAVNQLDSPRNNPYALAGILIKTKGAILDNQLFKFENDPAGVFFYGEALIEKLADRVRKGEMGIIDPNRAGLDWRHDYCKAIREKLEGYLEPIIKAKRKELEEKDFQETPEKYRTLLSGLSSLLNKLAKQEISLEQPVDPTKLEHIEIRPHKAHLELNMPRTFSVYAPKQILQGATQLTVSSDNEFIRVKEKQLDLQQHPDYQYILYGKFEVTGFKKDEKSIIECKLNSSEYDLAEVEVAPLGKGRKRKKLSFASGGFIRTIKTDETKSPLQRVSYEEALGAIKIYINFPAVRRYIGPKLHGAETKDGKVMLAELVGEIFCRVIARQKVEYGGEYPDIPGAEIDIYNQAVLDLQKKYLATVHNFIQNFDFENILEK